MAPPHLVTLALQNYDIPADFFPFVSPLYDFLLTFRKLGAALHQSNSRNELRELFIKHKRILLQLSRLRSESGGMEDTFAGSFILTLFDACHSHFNASESFKKAVKSWWPQSHAQRNKLRRHGCSPFDLSKLPDAAMDRHFLSLKPSTPPAPSQHLGTIDVDASDDDNNDTVQAGPSRVVECGSSDDDSSDAVSASEEHVPTHDSSSRDSSYVVPDPPEDPQAGASSSDDNDFEPPPASAEEINRFVLSQRLGDIMPTPIFPPTHRRPRIRHPVSPNHQHWGPRSRRRSTSSSSDVDSDEEGETAPSLQTRPLISRADYEDVEMSGVEASEPSDDGGFATNNMAIEDEAGDGEEDDKDIEEHSMSSREVKERREALSALKNLGNPRVPRPRSETPPPIPPSAAVIKTRIGRTVNAPRRLGSSTAVIPTMRPSSGPLTSKRKRDSTPEPQHPIRARSMSAAAAPASEDGESSGSDSPPPKKAKTSSKTKGKGPAHKHSGSRSRARFYERPQYGTPPPDFKSPDDMEIRDADSVLGTPNKSPAPLWTSLPGTNNADEEKSEFWDPVNGYFLSKGQSGVPDGVIQDLRGYLSVPGQLDLHVNHFVNATAPMRAPALGRSKLVCFSCVLHPETCVPFPADDEQHLSNSRKCLFCVQKKLSCVMSCPSEEFDKMKELCAGWGESSEAGLSRQFEEIANGRRTVERLITTRNDLDTEIQRLANRDAALVAKLRECCRDPRDILRVLSRNDPDFQLSMPTIMQLCSVFGWDFSELPEPLQFGRHTDGTPYLRNQAQGDVLMIPSTSEFPTGTPAPAAGPSRKGGLLFSLD
ncbi:hypothetical protein AAF712_010412 [Marasmius tenuissimus]|uniref:Uncharacterized protein n=1 Tax=Marasmius tenuissimus TaxID=585030 RepID=A0ABR2ZM32_9AGAR